MEEIELSPAKLDPGPVPAPAVLGGIRVVGVRACRGKSVPLCARNWVGVFVPQYYHEFSIVLLLV